MKINSDKYNPSVSDITGLLKRLIKEPSQSGNEDKCADIIGEFIASRGIPFQRDKNNIWAVNKEYDPRKPALLLNSHLDTVSPGSGWTRDPYEPAVENGRLYGLGSNDAGASLVSLLAAFLHFYADKGLNYNLIYAASAEEENTGADGIDSVLPMLGMIDLAIVGEPTGMQMAAAEKGLIVLRCQAEGVSGHAARDTGVNAIYKAVKDIQWYNTYQFSKISDLLGPVKMTVTQIQAGTVHNVIPGQCDFTVDIRTTDVYSHEEIMEIIKKNTKSKIVSSSLRLHPSCISSDHRLITIAEELNIKTFGSPALSDQARIQAPSVKIGPGLSERSHTADEFVLISEIETGIMIYIQLLEKLLLGVQ